MYPNRKTMRRPWDVRMLKYMPPANGKGCVLWTGALSHGYAAMGRDGRDVELVSRLILGRREGRELTAQEYACHTCDTPACVAEAHLFLGTPTDNAQDMIAKRRNMWGFGESGGAAKLTEAQVGEIRKLYATGLWTHRSLGARYGVSHTAIGWALRRQSWAGPSGFRARL